MRVGSVGARAGRGGGGVFAGFANFRIWIWIWRTAGLFGALFLFFARAGVVRVRLRVGAPIQYSDAYALGGGGGGARARGPRIGRLIGRLQLRICGPRPPGRAWRDGARPRGASERASERPPRSAAAHLPACAQRRRRRGVEGGAQVRDAAEGPAARGHKARDRREGVCAWTSSR